MDFPDFDEFANEFKEEFAAPADYSINNYPHPYCEMVESLPTACFEVNTERSEKHVEVLLWESGRKLRVG